MATNVSDRSLVSEQKYRYSSSGAAVLDWFGSLTEPRRNVVQIALDLVALNTGLWLADAVFDPRLGGFAGPGLTWSYLAVATSFYLIWRVLVAMTDTFEPPSISEARPQPFDLATATIVVIGLSVAAGLLLSAVWSSVDQWAVLPPAIVAFVVMVGARLAWARLIGPVFVRRLLMIGNGFDAQAIEAQLVGERPGRRTDFQYFHDIGVPSGVDSHRGSPLSAHQSQTVGRVLSENRVDAVVMTAQDGLGSLSIETALACAAQGTEFVDLPSLYERLLGRVSTTALGPDSLLPLRLHGRSMDRRRQRSKRAFDVIAASLGLLVLIPLLPLVALAIYMEDRGPIFYQQTRVGRFGKPFSVYKLRTMVVDAEPDGPVWATEGDNRVTRVGRLLRKSHADEFPQLVNILKGEMSAVGPRPERPEFVDELARQIPMYDLRHCVRPGMAGWGLIKQGYGSSVEDARLKLQYDLYYIGHQSSLLDLGIILRTISDGVTFRGR